MKHVIACVCAVLIVLSGLIALSPRIAAQGPTGTFVSTMTIFLQPSVTNAIQDLAQNRMDLYLWFATTPADLAAARSTAGVETTVVGGSLRDLQVNPIPVDPGLGKINPFSKREVREALNYLVNREFLVREIAPGNSPMYTMYYRAQPEYGREAVFFADIERRYAYNPTLGAQMIADALNADATYVNVGGKWMWHDGPTLRPVELTFVIRGADDRRPQGDYIAEVLEGLGFEVVRNYQGGAGANTIVYQGPPDIGAWHLYTEGFGGGAIEAFDDDTPWNFYVGDAYGSAIFYLGNHTGSCGACDLPATASSALITSATKLFEANYTGIAERQALLKQAVELSIKDSARIFLYNNAVFPYSSRVTEFVYDLNAGPWSFFTLRSARFATPDGNLRVGQIVWAVEGWQPWRVDWLYDVLQIQAFTDAPVFPHPHTGLYIPVRSTFTVEPATTVPGTALAWDRTTLGFSPATAATPVKSKVSYTFTFGQWHDGSTFDMDDILYELALVYRRANGPLGRGDINTIDPDAAAGASVLFARVVKGFDVSGNTISLYMDYAHPDASTTASVVLPMFPVSPWTASELAMSTIRTPDAATAPCRVSGTTATAEGKDHVDMAKGPCRTAMANNLPALIAANGGTGHRPPGLDAYITPAEATARWASLLAFSTAHGHFFASNGPFVLDQVNTAAEQASYVRWTGYPFPADTWDTMLNPKIPEISFAPAPSVVIGNPATFDLTSRVANAAYDRVNITWLLVNPSRNEVLAQGYPTRVSAGNYRITLGATVTGSLGAGAYDLRTVTVGEEAAVPVFATSTFVAIPEVEIEIAQLRATVETLQRDLDRQLDAQANETTRLNAALNSAQTTATAAIAVGVIGIIAGMVSLAVAMRRRRSPAPPVEPPEQM